MVVQCTGLNGKRRRNWLKWASKAKIIFVELTFNTIITSQRKIENTPSMPLVKLFENDNFHCYVELYYKGDKRPWDGKAEESDRGDTEVQWKQIFSNFFLSYFASGGFTYCSLFASIWDIFLWRSLEHSTVQYSEIHRGILLAKVQILRENIDCIHELHAGPERKRRQHEDQAFKAHGA